MKRFLFLILFFISLPAFAVPGYQDAMDAIGGKPIYCDISESQAYFEKLEKQFFEKYPNGNFTGEQYNKEVMIPFLDFEAELQKKGYCGYN